MSQGTWRKNTLVDDYLKSASENGFPVMKDVQDLKSVGFERMSKFISPEGIRQDAAHSYLHPLLQDGAHPNLHLRCHTKVCRVIFDHQNRATGVEYISREIGASNGPSHDTTIRVARARKLVVIASGTLGSPAILERSGVGNAADLEKLGIKLVADVPGVGKNYRDHPFIHFPYKSSLPEDETLDWILRNPSDYPKAMTENNPVLGTNGLETFGRMRPSTAEIRQLGNTTLSDMWAEEFVPQPSRPLMLTGCFAGYLGAPSDVPAGQYFTIGNYIPYPRSMGSVHITGKDIDAPLDLRTGFFEDNGAVDLAVHVWAYKRTREIARRMGCYSGEAIVGHPRFPPNSKAALVDVNPKPGVGSVLLGGPLEDIEYTAEDNKAIEECIRERIATAWHYLGSAAMRPREKDGVVDKSLNVYGVRNLKVAGMFSFSISLNSLHHDPAIFP